MDSSKGSSPSLLKLNPGFLKRSSQKSAAAATINNVRIYCAGSNNTGKKSYIKRYTLKTFDKVITADKIAESVGYVGAVAPAFAKTKAKKSMSLGSKEIQNQLAAVSNDQATRTRNRKSTMIETRSNSNKDKVRDDPSDIAIFQPKLKRTKSNSDQSSENSEISGSERSEKFKLKTVLSAGSAQLMEEQPASLMFKRNSGGGSNHASPSGSAILSNSSGNSDEKPSACGFRSFLEEEQIELLKRLEDSVPGAKNENPNQTNYTFIDKSVQLSFQYMEHFKKENIEEIKKNQVQGIFFFFSLDDRESFEYAEYLLNSFKNNCSNTDFLSNSIGINQSHTFNVKQALLLVGTKSDLPRKVQTNEIRLLAKQFDIQYYECSAKENENISESFTDLMNQIEFIWFHYQQWANTRELIARDKLCNYIISRNYLKIKSLLLSNKSTPSELFVKFDWSPIHVACWEGYFECVSLFILFDPDCINCKSKNNYWTPLHITSRMGNLSLVKYLLDSGADIFAADSQNRLASDTRFVTVRQFITSRLEARNRVNKMKTSLRFHGFLNNIPKDTAELDISFSKLSNFPKIISQCSELKTLNLMGNLLKDINTDYSKLKHLKELILNNNEINSLPDEITDLINLEIFDIRRNKLTAITPGIGSMVKLKKLLLSHNLLNYLPSQIANLEQTLEIFEIYGNPFATIPQDVIPKLGDVHPHSMPHLFAYLRSITTGGNQIYNRVKIMFVGDGNVGKTSLFNCIQEKDLRRTKVKKSSNEREPTDTIATDGIDIHQVLLPLPNGQEMIWDCWDYAGQEVYYTTHQFFLSPRSIYFICFNLLDRNMSKIEYWMNSIHTRAKGSPMILIGTHIDDKACTQEYINNYVELLQSTIKPQRFKNNAGNMSVKGIYTVSCKKRIGIKDLIEDVTELVQGVKFIGQLFPKTWIKLEDTLTSMSLSVPLLKWEEFKRVASGCNIEEGSIKDAAIFLHNSGIICYFNDKKLSDIVILSPQFLTKVMSSIITLKHRYGNDGILFTKDLQHIWRDYPANIHKTLMNLLERFDIAFVLPLSKEQRLKKQQQKKQPKEHSSKDKENSSSIEKSSYNSLNDHQNRDFDQQTSNEKDGNSKENGNLSSSGELNKDKEGNLGNGGGGGGNPMGTLQSQESLTQILYSIAPPQQPQSRSGNNSSLLSLSQQLQQNEMEEGQKYIFPCLLSDSKPNEILYNKWEVTMNQKVKGLVFSRVYSFEFLPLGFFSRLIVRNFHLPNFKSPIYWSNGHLLECGNITALLRFNPTIYKLTLTIHSRNADIDLIEYNLSVKLLRLLIENIETTIEGWYDCSVDVSIPCSHCILNGDYSQWQFTLKESMTAITSGYGYLLCRNLRRVRLDILVPDLSFADLQHIHIPYDDIKISNFIGEGSYGSVYYGIWNNIEVAVKLVNQQIQGGDDTETTTTESEINTTYDDQTTTTTTTTGGTNTNQRKIRRKKVRKQHTEDATTEYNESMMESELDEEEEEEEEMEEEEEDDNYSYSTILLGKFNEFLREVWIMSCMHHKNVCSLIGICNNPMAIIMEYLPLGNLFRLVGSEEYKMKNNGEKLTAHQLAILSCREQIKNTKLKLLLCLDIGRGMKHLHNYSPPIVHRDLRTPNIFVSTLDINSPVRAKVGDFGLSLHAASTISGGNFNLYWLAPEVMLNEQYTIKIDVYSFGIIMWELLTLERPFEEYVDEFIGKSSADFKAAVINGLRPSIGNQSPPELGDLIKRCWTFNPQERPDFNEIVSELERLCEKYKAPYEPYDDLLIQPISDVPNPSPKRDHSWDFRDEKFKLNSMNVDDAPKDSAGGSGGINKGGIAAPQSPMERQLSSAQSNSPPRTSAGRPKSMILQEVALIDEFQVFNYTKKLILKSGGIQFTPPRILSMIEVIPGKTVWVATSFGEIFIINSSTQDIIKSFIVSDKINNLVLIEKNAVWISDDAGYIYIYSIEGKKLHTVKEHHTSIQCMLQLSHTGQFGTNNKKVSAVIWSADTDGVICVWFLRNKKPKPKMKQRIRIGRCITCLYQFHSIVCIGTSGPIILHDLETLSTVGEWTGHTSRVNALNSFNDDVWSVSDDGSIRVWHIWKAQSIIPPLEGHTGKILCSTQYKNYILTGSFDMTIAVWDASTYRLVQELRGQHIDGITCLLVVGNTLWSGSLDQDGSICIWSTVENS